MPRIFKEIIILGLAVFAFAYLMFPSFLPDFIPFVGWIDEGVATLILLNTIRYYGLDLTSLYSKPPTTKRVVRRKKVEEPMIIIQESERE